MGKLNICDSNQMENELVAKIIGHIGLCCNIDDIRYYLFKFKNECYLKLLWYR